LNTAVPASRRRYKVEKAVGDVKKCRALEILVVCRSRATGVQ